jgi:hypothetical protein
MIKDETNNAHTLHIVRQSQPPESDFGIYFEGCDRCDHSNLERRKHGYTAGG